VGPRRLLRTLGGTAQAKPVPLLSYAEAACLALAEAMRAGPNVVALGEDLGRGGVFGQYKGLWQEFGAARVIDTPISESTIMGAAVGMALVGLRPVVEMRVTDFALCAMDELINQAAKNRYMFGGQGRVPLVARMPGGIWGSSAAQHSQSLEAWFAHVPGLVVVAPSTPADNYALLTAAIECDDPVVYQEHKELWGLQGEVPANHRVELGRASVSRPGSDLTLISWSKMVHSALEAADAAAKSGISVEVIDLRTIWPWDRETVLASAVKTGRLLVAHEAVRVAGFGAEIAATVAEVLGIPVKRLGSPRIPVGYAKPLEDQARITGGNILEAIMDFTGGRGSTGLVGGRDQCPESQNP
jgi:pyruvate dehydrogenase E1 component beta subunit